MYCLTAISKSPAKSPVKITNTNNTVSAKPRKSPIPQSITSKNNEPDNKENGTCMVRSKLQRLGKLYSGKQNNKNILTCLLLRE